MVSETDAIYENNIEDEIDLDKMATPHLEQSLLQLIQEKAEFSRNVFIMKNAANTLPTKDVFDSQSSNSAASGFRYQTRNQN